MATSLPISCKISCLDRKDIVFRCKCYNISPPPPPRTHTQTSCTGICDRGSVFIYYHFAKFNDILQFTFCFSSNNVYILRYMY